MNVIRKIINSIIDGIIVVLEILSMMKNDILSSWYLRENVYYPFLDNLKHFPFLMTLIFIVVLLKSVGLFAIFFVGLLICFSISNLM